jgi:hypothetical protein
MERSVPAERNFKMLESNWLGHEKLDLTQKSPTATEKSPEISGWDKRGGDGFLTFPDWR